MKKKFSVILTIFLVFSTFNVVQADNIQDAKKNLEESNKAINENKNKVNEIDKSKEKVENQIEAYDTEMNKVSNSITTINKDVEKLNSDITLTTKEVKELEVKIKEEEEAFYARARVMYTQGSFGYMGALIGSNSFSDFLSRVNIVSRIIEFDKELIQQTKNNKKQIEEKKAKLEQDKMKSDALKEKKALQVKALQAKSDEKTTLVKNLEKDKEYYIKKQQQEEAEAQEIKTSLARLQAEAKKKAEEEAKKENNNSDNKGGSNTGSNTGKQSGGLYCVTGKAYTISSSYGYRIHPITNKKTFHSGIDIAVPMGTPIYSLRDGLVIRSEWISGYGNVVMVDHGNYISLYAHNSSLAVSTGQTVKGGQLISYAGSTGNSTGPHLHFEIRLPSGDTTDPTPYYIP